MFDTYGFPVELTEEILKEKGFIIDVKGYEILRKITKNNSKNTFHNRDKL